MTTEKAQELLLRHRRRPEVARTEAVIREYAAELVDQIAGHPLTQTGGRGLIIDVTLPLRDRRIMLTSDATEPSPSGNPHIGGRVWVPDADGDDRFKAQLVVEAQLREIAANGGL